VGRRHYADSDADSAREIVKFTISIPRESCTNAKAKYSSSLVPRDPSVHFYHCCSGVSTVVASASGRSIVTQLNTCLVLGGPSERVIRDSVRDYWDCK